MVRYGGGKVVTWGWRTGKTQGWKTSEKVSHGGGITYHVEFFQQDHSVPVKAPPTEAPEMELDASSGPKGSTEASKDGKGEDQ